MLQTFGFNPFDFLVLPRMLALVVMMPLLYVYGCAAGLFGGFLVGATMLDLTPSAYFDRTFLSLAGNHLSLGITKAVVFGALVALAGCYCGLNAQRNAAGVGMATTKAVVVSIVGVILLDALFAVCANALDI